jgi:tripartite-type tricarboxylate transporter receptor subunit TctC
MLATVRLALALSAALYLGAAHADSYPSRSVRVIAPYSAGGASDVMARYFGQKLSEHWGQPIVIDNQPGAAGSAAYIAAAKAPADGYTIAYATSSFAANAVLKPKLGYDPVREFAPVSTLLEVQNVLVVPASLPVQSVADLVALAKKRPGELNYVSLGVGSSPHLSMELFRSATGINIQHVPYKLTTQGYTDLIEGRVQLWLSSMPSALPFIRSGKLRALAVAGAKRSPALPDVPTLTEAGVQAETTFWHAFFVSAGTPPDIVGKVNAGLRHVIAQKETRDWFLNLGAEIGASTPEELAAVLQKEMAKWTKIAKDIGLELQ